MRRKSYVGNLEVGGETFICGNWQVWPPKEAFLTDGMTAEEARSRMEVDAYNRLSVWEKACGLMKMEEGKCMSCPYLKPFVEPPARKGFAPPLRIVTPPEKKALPQRVVPPVGVSSQKRKKKNF